MTKTADFFLAFIIPIASEKGRRVQYKKTKYIVAITYLRAITIAVNFLSLFSVGYIHRLLKYARLNAIMVGLFDHRPGPFIKSTVLSKAMTA